MFFFASVIYGQDVKSHDVHLNINVKEKVIDVVDDVGTDFKNNNTVKFVLWKNTSIKEISISGKPVQYAFDTVASSPIIYIPNGRGLTIVKPSGSDNNVSVHFSYVSDMKELKGWANSFSEEWIELNFYCAWFPVCLTSGSFTSKININIDNNFTVSGSGKISHGKDGWEMTQPWKSFDNVVIASKNLKYAILDEKNIYVQTDYSVLPPNAADSILAEWKFVINLYENYFGKRDSSYLKFVVAPFEKGGGYSRKNFVCLRTKEFGLYTRTGIAHEAAHFWWQEANTTTWEDWLNEAFAEYSMLMYVHERLGNDEFIKLIDEYRSRTKNLPHLWGMDRNSPDSYSVIYEKGSLILYDFENAVGKEAFIGFLKEVAADKINTTEKLLDHVEKHFSTERKLWLENKLKND